jgi:hypothetical protein
VVSAAIAEKTARGQSMTTPTHEVPPPTSWEQSADPPKPMGPGAKGTGGAGSIVIGVPTPGSPGTVFPGEGASCVPVPVNGVCPAGYRLDLVSEAARCI